VKAAAYAYADGSLETPPKDLILLGYIDRFGAQNVLGRPLSGWEVRRMMLSERVLRAYNDRQRSNKWAEWAEANPEDAQLLNEAMLIYEKHRMANDGG